MRKLVAIFLLTLSALYLAQRTFIATGLRQGSMDGDRLSAVQNLHAQGGIFLNLTRSFFSEHGRIPHSDELLYCVPEQGCPHGQMGDVYYFRVRDAWLAIEPYVEDQKVLFECWITITHKFIDQSQSSPFQNCKKLEVSAVPKWET